MDYSPMLQTAMAADNFAALEVAAAQGVASFYADPNTDVTVLAWLARTLTPNDPTANQDVRLRAFLSAHLIFFCTDAALLQYAGVFAPLTLSVVEGVFKNYVTALVGSLKRAHSV